jgi:hypothetical protein
MVRFTAGPRAQPRLRSSFSFVEFLQSKKIPGRWWDKRRRSVRCRECSSDWICGSKLVTNSKPGGINPAAIGGIIEANLL